MDVRLYKPQVIRVCHVVNALDVGGMENGVVNLCNNLDRSKFEPMACCLYHIGPMANRLKPDVRVFNMRQPQGKAIFSILKLAGLFRQIKPDIVHTHGWGGGSLYGILGAKLAGVSVIINGEHGSFFLKDYQVVLQRALASMCVLTVSVSASLKARVVRNLGIPDEKICVITNGVDTSKFTGEHDYSYIVEECAKKHGGYLSKDNFIVGSIGSLKAEKNQIMFLKALREIRQTNSEKKIKVIFVGDGPDFHKLVQFVKNNGLERDVVFLGNRQDIPQLLSAFDVLISTSISRHEGMSNVILEAMSSGLPVIATKSVGTSEVIREGEAGFLIEENDVSALINKINLLRDDPELVRSMGTQARKIAKEQYSIAKMVENYEKLYLRILQGKKK